jgi:DNA (cytosine-5)-methyltransferase 1
MTDLQTVLESMSSTSAHSSKLKLAEDVGSQHQGTRGKPFTCGGLFAGIGGFCFGFEEAGFETLWCNDLSKDAGSAYLKNFDGAQFINRDVKSLRAMHDLAPVDVLHAGFPCQSFSAAGFRLGFEDPRGQLFFEIVRLLKEWGEKKPKVVVLENSPHLKDGEGGTWFRTVQTEIQRAGYWFASPNAFVLDTREHGGLPQRRKRLFMIAVNQDFADFNPIDLSGIEARKQINISNMIRLNEKNDYYYLHEDSKYAHMIQKQVINEDPYQLYQLRKYFVRVPEKGVCPTLTANMGLGGHNVPFIQDGGRMRKLTERECLDLQGFPQTFEFPEEMVISKRYELIGNSVSPVISKLIAKQVSSFLAGETS